VQALTFSQHGDPIDVLHLTDLDEPSELAEGDVRVRVLRSPVNHSDQALIRGTLGTRPLPAIAGNEGVGRVAQLGAGVSNVSVGDLVPLPLLAGAWRAFVDVSAGQVVSLPDGNVDQYSMIGSNSATAGLALSEYVSLHENEWVIQTGANGAFGRNVIALARKRGYRTLSIVRRDAHIDELLSIGGDEVLVDGPDLPDRIRRRLGGEPVRLALDGVGGAVSERVASVLQRKGVLVRYANASGEGVDATRAMFADRDILVPFIFTPQFDFETKIAPAILEAAQLIRSGDINIPHGELLPLKDFVRAFDGLAAGQKVLFAIGDE